METMEITSKPPIDTTPLVLVIGKFDGIHKGHQAVLRAAGEKVGNADKLAVMSFSEPPLWVLTGKTEYKHCITTEKDKIHLFQQFGVDRYYRISFTKDYAETTPEEFVFDHLARLNIKHIVIGEDFRFGKGGNAGAEELVRLCKDIKIDVSIVPLIKQNGEKISSKTIRQLIKQGLMEPANSLLGRPFTMTGKVVHGEKVGRRLGFPTINLGSDDSYVPPKPGVYLGTVCISDHQKYEQYWNVLISAGYRPTVNGNGYLVEGHLLNFSGDLYGKEAAVSFLRYMREEIKFTDLEALREQMEKDKRDAEKLLGMNS
ncbi:bifunctional riboflavin kinase/FAD synthetase [Sediminibacillus massiliensis]|uniref:bifunctional riboflavin kinase/FAD synthetase n=1 Tax=Sediminibacillus massiliensis TaxID=1926277 RepID=UPI0009884E47|nr:bifunctional riboflavin kinase/FAD synthetase [Sediminibacillus massiliensis]